MQNLLICEIMFGELIKIFFCNSKNLETLFKISDLDAGLYIY